MDILTLAIAKNKFGSANETITTENITNALGYKPANQEDLRKLSEDIADLKENGTGTGNGATTAQANSLWAIIQKSAFAQQLTDAEINAFKTEWGIEVVTIPCTGITLNKTTLSFADNTSQTLTATVEPSNTTDKAVWKSSNTSVATVTNGVVKPLSNGSCTITATCGSVSATCSVTVNIAEKEQVTLSSISATYTGGDVVVGTSVNSLTGITVKAHYSDGSTKTITDYTLNGEIVEGENIITVSYGGMTATFTVNGTVDSGNDEPVNNGWEDGVPYDFSNYTNGYYVDFNDGSIKTQSNYSVTDYLPCRGASEIRVLEGSWGPYNAYYDENKQYVGALRFDTNAKYVPANAYYIRVSENTGKFASVRMAPIA